MTAETVTPYEKIGGAAAVRRLAEAFYDVMDTPEYTQLRAMHEPDLGPTREALAGFLTAWLGGPRDWITSQGGFCVMSRHAGMGITEGTRAQWMAAMQCALAQAEIAPPWADKMMQALEPVSRAMLRRR
ncbi:MAG: group II truncated hemoglobin [Acidocella sp.]|nr:group II truncated hemoglobin [Acidocella sp.]